jgi:YHS domain-containing protein
MQVDETRNLPASNYQNTKYTFHAQECKEKFDRNPQQYIGQAQQGGQSEQGQPRQQQTGQSQQAGRGQQDKAKTGGSGAGGGA